jgi:hypothetical protein
MMSLEQYHIILAERNTAWRELTPTQQLTILNQRLGDNIGATRQRAKLEVAILACQTPVVRDTVVPSKIVEKPVMSAAEGRRRQQLVTDARKRKRPYGVDRTQEGTPQ